MSENFVNPTYYNLQKAIIRSEFSSFEADITGLIPSISITSSIDSETMFGSLRIIDSVGLLDGEEGVRGPLRGEEQIILEIADSKLINENGGVINSEIEDIYRFVGFVYKIDNITAKEINDAMIYDIHFISYQSFKAGMYEIIRSFIDKKISDIVKTLFDQYYINSEDLKIIPSELVKKLILEETDGVIRCWIPKMKTEEAMMFLSKRSYSTQSPSCTFRFFESSRGYHYVTDEHLFRIAEDPSEKNYDPKRKFEFTYLDAIPNTLEYFKHQINNLEILENTSRVNSLDDILNGAYRNKVLELDILSRNLNLLDDSINQYDYFKKRDKYQNINTETQTLVDRHTKKFIETIHRGDETDVQKEWIVIKNYTSDEESDENNSMQAQTYYAEIVSNRQAYSKHIHSITVSAKGPGRFDITAGDIVELKIQEFKFADGRKKGFFDENKHLSGNYIVKSVTHSMDKEEMFNSYVFIKKDWSGVENI
jgi:hypothetical protein